MQVFQVLPSIVRSVDNELQIDVDFYEAIKIYLEHFESVSIACPVTTSSTKGTGLERCREINQLDPHRFMFVPLPHTHSLFEFVSNLGDVRQLLKSEIQKADFLVFSPHTPIADWPTVATREAIRLNKAYVIEADVVYESVSRNAYARNPPWKRRLKEALLIPQFERSYRRSLNHSRLALFQGQDVYDAYAPFCQNPHKVYHHIPIYKEDHISETQLQAKLRDISAGAPLNVCYVGRAIDMKGPIDWLKTVHELLKRGVQMKAIWVGDGSLLPLMRETAQELGIADQVRFPGFISDRREILQIVQTSDIFLYCHKTQESARCLGEALACGCPIVGYDGAYPSDIVAEHGGGLFADLGDWEKLAKYIQDLNCDRTALCQLVRQASLSGKPFDRTKLLHDKMNLIKQYY